MKNTLVTVALVLGLATSAAAELREHQPPSYAGQFKLDGTKDGTTIKGRAIQKGLTTTNAMCALSGISGRFDATKESVRIYPNSSGEWVYDLTAGKADIIAWVSCWYINNYKIIN